MQTSTELKNEIEYLRRELELELQKNERLFQGIRHALLDVARWGWIKKNAMNEFGELNGDELEKEVDIEIAASLADKK
jgi:hypothetical protein